MSRLFEAKEHAKLYSSFRPRYPSEIYEHIMMYLSEKCSSRLLALDIGCGSGQGTLPLAKHFEQVIGLDVSEAQISEAPRTQGNVSFRVGCGENLSFVESGTVDLITVAATLHWMDGDRFYEEARRVLRSNGVLAVYGYRLLHVRMDNKEAEEILSKQLYERLSEGGCIHPRVLLVHSFFEDAFTLPFRDFQRERGICMSQACTIEQIQGFISTYSAYQQYIKDHPGSTLLRDIAKRLKKILTDEENENESLIQLSWPMFLILGRK